MTVGELIARLTEFDPALPVRYEDYEQGPTDIDYVELASKKHKQLKMPKPFDENEDYVSLA